MEKENWESEWEIYFEDKISNIFYRRERTGVDCTFNKNVVKAFIADQIKQAEERAYERGYDQWFMEAQELKEGIIKSERERIIKLIKEKGLHLGYANDIIELINQNNVA